MKGNLNSLYMNRVKDYKVSIVMVCYNPSMRALFFTLDSILKQKYVDIEIIVADDGSSIEYESNLLKYFDKMSFNKFKLVFNRDNHGTVFNFYSGLKCSNNEFIKGMSPGDAFCYESALYEWLNFNTENNYSWSFSDYICYNYDGSEYIVLSLPAHPNDIGPYLSKKHKKCIWNYIVKSDIALGAAILAKTDLLKNYISKILGDVKYGEDNVWRMMMFDGICGGYFNKDTLFYEYGSGISTNPNSKLTREIKNDWSKTDSIMFANIGIASKFQKKMFNNYINKKKLINRLISKINIFYKVYKYFHIRYTKKYCFTI